MLALETLRRARPTIQVRVGPPVAQSRRLHELPRIGQHDLAMLVARHSGRYFRKNGIPLVTSARWARRGPASGAPSAIAAAAEEPWIIAIESALEASAPNRFQIVPTEAPDLVLQSAKALARRRHVERGLTRRLVAGCCLVWLAAAAVSVLRQQLDLRWLRQEQARLTAPATAVSQARRRLHDAMRSVTAVRDHASHRGAVLASLVDVLNAMPDSAYLQSFRWRADGSGSLSGAGPDAADVLARLETVTRLPAPRMQGAAAADVTSGVRQEHFTIRFGNAEP